MSDSPYLRFTTPDGSGDGTPYLSGATSPLPFPPRRVVSLVPALTESLFELNLGTRLVGRTEYCRYPTESVGRLPAVGTPAQPDIERILQLRPDAVLGDGDENPQDMVDALQAAGVVVWTTAPRSARDTLNRLWDIMYAFDEPSMVERVRAIEWTCDWLERLDETRTRECRVFIARQRDPLMTISSDSYTHDLLRVCGGANVLADHPSETPVTLEMVEAAQPDVILLVSDETNASTFTRDDISRFVVLNCPAARDGAISLIEETLLFWRGTRIARAFNDLPLLLCLPEAE